MGTISLRGENGKGAVATNPVQNRPESLQHTQKPHLRGAIDLSRNSFSLEAPASDHMIHSFATVWRTVATQGLSPLKTQSFLCFQISHNTRMMRELSPFLVSLSLPLSALDHHLDKLVVSGPGAIWASPILWRIINQTCRGHLLS